jgi:hypothetical protein
MPSGHLVSIGAKREEDRFFIMTQDEAKHPHDKPKEARGHLEKPIAARLLK